MFHKETVDYTLHHKKSPLTVPTSYRPGFFFLSNPIHPNPTSKVARSYCHTYYLCHPNRLGRLGKLATYGVLFFCSSANNSGIYPAEPKTPSALLVTANRERARRSQERRRNIAPRSFQSRVPLPGQVPLTITPLWLPSV